MRELMNDLGDSKLDNLVAGFRFPLMVKGVELAAGQGVLKRGTVLAINTTTGQAHPVDSAGANGTNEPDCILVETMDTDRINFETISRMRPLKENSSFKGAIRFHNLKQEELGALLSALTFHGKEK